MSDIKVRIATDNALELVGGGLLIAGIAVVVGLGAALLAAAFVAVMLAEFSWAGKVWLIPLPTRKKNRKGISRKRRKQLANRPLPPDAGPA